MGSVMLARWIKLANGPDIDVPDWLNSGAPLGIEEDMTPRGVFPIIDERTAEEDRKPCEIYGETFQKYASRRESIRRAGIFGVRV